MELNGKKVNFLGDSITEGVGVSDTAHRYTDVFSQMTGAIVRNYGISGTRIARKRIPTPGAPQFDKCFLDRVELMEDDADIVVVFGGTNDFGHGDAPIGTWEDTDEYTFYGAMKSLVERLMKRYPSSEIVFMTPLHRSSEMRTQNEIGLPCLPLESWVNAEKEVCARYGVPVLDLWSVSGIQPRVQENFKAYTADGLHPNNLGAERIACRLVGFLKTL